MGAGGDNGRELILNNEDVEVIKVHVAGLVKTKSDYLLDDVKPVFDATTFLDTYRRSLECRDRMMGRGIFKNVDVVIDTTGGYQGAPDNGVQVVFNVTERNRVVGSVATEMSNSDRPRWVAKLVSPNLWGRGEVLSADLAHSMTSTSDLIHHPTDLSVGFMKPMGGSAFTLRLAQEKQDCGWSSYTNTNRGGEVGVKFPLWGNTHQISWSGMWRELTCLNPCTGFDVRTQMGNSLKSSIIHTMTVDKSDDPILPMRGSIFTMEEEVAGIGGDVKFVREKMGVKFVRSFFGRMTFEAGLQAGLMLPWGGSTKTEICDKFFIGGPLTLRGFEFNSVGPRSSSDFLGSGAFWLSGFHIYTPIPFYWSKFGSGSWLDNFRTHGFINCGNAFDVDLSSTTRGNLMNAATNVRVSCGVGLVYKFMNSARLEFNFCVPIRSEGTDKTIRGLQFGLGVTSI